MAVFKTKTDAEMSRLSYAIRRVISIAILLAAPAISIAILVSLNFWRTHMPPAKLGSIGDIAFPISIASGALILAMAYFLRDTRSGVRTTLSSRETLDRIKMLEVRLRGLASEVKLATSDSSVSESSRENLIEAITEEAKAQFLSKLDSDIQSRYGKAAFQRRQRGTVRSRSEDCFDRLRAEVSQQKRRGNLNLILGTVAMLLGFFTLFYLVFASARDSDQTQASILFLRFCQRLSIVIVVELFAYFFLNLYKAGLAEIRYYQNELTNLELRLLALHCAVSIDDTKTMETILLDITHTERNHILRKGESTADLERSKIDAKQAQAAEKLLTELLSRIAIPKKED